MLKFIMDATDSPFLYYWSVVILTSAIVCFIDARTLSFFSYYRLIAMTIFLIMWAFSFILYLPSRLFAAHREKTLNILNKSVQIYLDFTRTGSFSLCESNIHKTFFRAQRNIDCVL